MVTRDVLREKIEQQVAEWKPTIDGLKEKIEHAEVDAKEKLHKQLELLHDKLVKTEKILEEISATSQDGWEQVKAGFEQVWTDLTRTAKDTVAKVREAIAKPKRDEEIRQIAYRLWRDEGCPDGRHLDHWFKAESLWRARQKEATKPHHITHAHTRQPRKNPATSANTNNRATQRPGRRGKQPPLDNKTP